MAEKSKEPEEGEIMPDLMTQLERLTKLAEILSRLYKEYDNKKFWALSKEFDNEVELHKLEDSLNEVKPS